MNFLKRTFFALAAFATLYIGLDLIFNPNALATPLARWAVGIIVTSAGAVQCFEFYMELTNKQK